MNAFRKLPGLSTAMILAGIGYCGLWLLYYALAAWPRVPHA